MIKLTLCRKISIDCPRSAKIFIAPHLVTQIRQSITGSRITVGYENFYVTEAPDEIAKLIRPTCHGTGEKP